MYIYMQVIAEPCSQLSASQFFCVEVFVREFFIGMHLSLKFIFCCVMNTEHVLN